MKTSIVLSLLLLLAYMCGTSSAHRRTLRQEIQDFCSASPGPIPIECSNTIPGIGGNQWDDDEIECALGDYQLKCDLDTDIFTSADVDCELDAGFFTNAVEFSCPRDSGCNINCSESDLAELNGLVPQQIIDDTLRILDIWKPTE